jgi:DNA ligase-1
MYFKDLIDLFEKLTLESKSSIKQVIVEQYLTKLNDVSLKSFIYICDESVKEKKETFVSNSTLKKLGGLSDFNIGEVYEKKLPDYTLEQLHELYKEDEDWYLKLVDDKFIKTIEWIPFVFKILSLLQGKNCRYKKERFMNYIISKYTSSLEIEYFKRILSNNLRIGIKGRSLLPVLAKICKKDFLKLKIMYNTYPSVYNCLYNTHTTDFIKPMLLKQYTESNYSKLITRTQFVYETKFDGFRIQIHVINGTLEIYSRNFLNLTNNLKNICLKHIPITATDNFILDGQLIGVDFQTISKIIMNKQNCNLNINVEFKFFDILKLDSEFLMYKKYIDRKLILKSILTNKGIEKTYVEHYPVSTDLIQKVINREYSLEKTFEGLVLKTIDSTYEPNVRTNNWLKLKPNFNTADLAIIKAYKGTGMYEVYYSSFMLGAKDEVGNLLEVGAIGSGFTGAQIELLTELIKKESNEEEVILKTPIVIEIRYQGIQKSSKYNSNISLRFPVCKSIRFDKDSRDVDSIIDLCM